MAKKKNDWTPAGGGQPISSGARANTEPARPAPAPAPVMTSRPVQVQTYTSTPGPTIQSVGPTVQAPSVTYNGLDPGDGSAFFTPGDFQPDNAYLNWARSIGAANVPAGGGGGNDGLQGQIDALKAQIAQLLAANERQERLARENASAFLTGILRQFNMESLAPQVDELVRQWGTSTEVIAEKLRQTNEYKDRFKGLLNLQQRGVTDVRDEAQYLQLESGYRRVFREAGIQSYIGEAGSVAERDAIADLVSKFSLSVDEVQSRVQDAQRVVEQSTPEVRDALQRFYNVSASDLVAYTLDPERTMNRINRIANAAIVGGFAGARGLDVDLSTAEMAAGLAGDNDINVAQLTTDLTRARDVRDATRRLAEIEGTALTDSQVIQSEMNLEPGAQNRVRTLQSRERARFGGTSGVNTGTLSRAPSV